MYEWEPDRVSRGPVGGPLPPCTRQRYVPAAGFRTFTRLYDPVLAVTMRERRFRGVLADQVTRDLPPHGGLALDVGCGTGTFAIALQARTRGTRVVGVDGDPEVLELAAAKPGAELVEWHQALAERLPLGDRTADVVTMSLMLHHLLPDEKHAALREALRALRPGGRLHVVDWGRPRDPLMAALFFVVRGVDGFERTRDHAAGRLPTLIADSGFEPPERYGRMRTGFGVLEFLRASSPADRSPDA